MKHIFIYNPTAGKDSIATNQVFTIPKTNSPFGMAGSMDYFKIGHLITFLKLNIKIILKIT